jgi:Na+-driven multidrug efflux pump
MGLGIGATALVSRRIGEKQPGEASRAAVQAILLGALVAVPIAVGGGIFAPDLLRLMGATPEVVTEGTSFARIMFIGNASILLLFLINAIFRGAGDAAVAMRCLWIANLCNLILDPRTIVRCPTETPGTSVIASSRPAVPSSGIPISRARSVPV